MNLQAVAIAASLFLATAGVVSAQSPSTPGTSPGTSPRSPSLTTPGSSAAGTTAAVGRHSMEGEVTSIDAKKGWVHVKTDEGTMIMRFPTASLENVKKGDRITVSLALKNNGAPAK